jgi:hypothetical protein
MKVATLLFLALSLLSASPIAAEPPRGSAETDDAIAQAMHCLDDFMAAWNAHDVKALEAAMNFPHVRLNSDNVMRTIKKGETTQEQFERMQRNSPSLSGWDHSGWAKREVIAASPDKVHVQTQFVRYRADGSVLSSFDSLYVVTNEDGHWGVRMRSSFAP